MNRPVAFAIIAVSALAALGVAQAQKPFVQVAPIPHGEVGLLTVPHGALKDVAPLTVPQKVALIKTVTKSTEPAELDAPLHLDVRAPYLNANTYMASYGQLGIDPSFEPPELLMRGDTTGALQSATFAKVVFRAEANRTYLVDCAVRPGGSVTTTFYSTLSTSREGAAIQTAPATSAPPPDGHLTFVARKESFARKMELKLSANGSHWYLGTCDVTPVRGL